MNSKLIVLFHPDDELPDLSQFGDEVEVAKSSLVTRGEAIVFDRRKTEQVLHNFGRIWSDRLLKEMEIDGEERESITVA